MSKAVIALKYLESKFPVDLVEQITIAHKGSFGYSYVDEDGVNPSGSSGSPDPKGLVETQNQVKAQTVYIFGVKAPALDEDLQPWEMLRDSKNNIVCVGFYEGDFSGSAKVDSNHIPAYHANQTLARKLKMMLRALKDDGNALYEECKSEEFQAEIKELMSGDGSIVLHFGNDKILWFCNPVERKLTNTFGMFSDMCGWVEAKQTETKTPVVKAKGLDKLAALMAGKKAPVANAGTKIADAPVEHTTEPPKPNTMPSKAPTTYAGILATKTLRTLTQEKVNGMLKNGGRFRHLENWYMNVNGDGQWPAGHTKASIQDIWNKIKEHEKDGTWTNFVVDLPGVLSKKDREEANKEYASLVEKGWATDVTEKTGVTNKVETQGKDDVTKIVTPIEGNVLPEGDYLPIINENSQAHLDKFVVKFFDKSHRAIPVDPTKLKSYQDRYPNILEKAGVKDWSDMFGLPLDAYQMLAQRYDLARLAMFSMISEIERLRKMVPASQQAPASNSMLDGLPGARKRA